MSARCLSLLSAIEKNCKNPDNGSISEIVKFLSSTQQRSDLMNFISTSKFQKQHALIMFGGILPLLRYVLESECYVPQSALSKNDDNSDEASDSKIHSAISQEVVPDAESTEALLFLRYVATIAQTYMKAITSRRSNKNILVATGKRAFDIMEEVFTVVELLHDSLFELHSCGTEGINVQRAIACCCETYWDGEFIDREVIVTSLIPLLVLRSLDGNATRADIKRLWNVREMLSLLDFEDDSISYIRSLLLRTVSSPLYTKNPEGRRMIGHLFQLDKSLVKDMHTAMRAQISMAKSKSLEAYGDIYFRAWKESTESTTQEYDEHDDGDGHERSDADDIKYAIEEHVLQDLMYASLHAASPHMAKAMRSVLEPFHRKKNNPEIDQLLFRMYSPILWRSLTAANPLVRVHASSVLATTFPLRDPNGGKLHLKDVHDKSIKALLTLMNDVDPKVRVGGCDCSIRILGIYWDALSSNDIRSLLNQIVMKHAKDAASSIVRAQAVNGITLLLDSKASHGVLRPLLPLIGDLIHDRVERVRLMTVNLLLKVKKMKGFKYYHIVGRDHLLARLATEGNCRKEPNGPVANALTQLLSNSYLPQGVKGSEQIRRTLLFLTQNSKAARVFYSNIAYHLDITVISKLIGMLVKTLKIATERDIEKKEDGESGLHNDTQNIHLDTVIASNTKLMLGISQALCTLIAAIGDCLKDPGNEKCLAFVQGALNSKTIISLCAHFEAKIDFDRKHWNKNDCHHICDCLLNCASLVPPSDRSAFFTHLKDRLQRCKDSKRENHWKRINIISYLAVICSWNMQDEVAIALSRSMSSLFTADEEFTIDLLTSPNLPATKGRRKRKQSDMNDYMYEKCAIPAIPGHISVHLLAQIVSSRESSSLVVRDAFVASENASSIVENALERATIAAEHIINGTVISCAPDDIELVLSAWESLGCYIMHKEAFKGVPLELNSRALSLLEWVTHRAIPSIISKGRERASCSPFRDLNLSRISVTGSYSADSPAPLSPIGVVPPRRKSNLSETQSKIDSSFVDMENQGDMEFRLGSKGSHYVHSMIISLIKTTLFIFSDWIMVGGKGFNDIIQHVMEWQCIFDCKLRCINTELELFPSYCRFSTIVANSTKQFDLFKIVLKIGGTLGRESEATRCINEAVSFLVSRKLRDANIEGLLNVAFELVEDHFKFNTTKDSETLSDFLRSQTMGIECLFHGILSYREGVNSFVNALMGRMLEKTDCVSIYECFLFLLYQEHPRGEIKSLVRDFMLSNVASNDTKLFKRIRDAIAIEVNS